MLCDLPAQLCTVGLYALRDNLCMIDSFARRFVCVFERTCDESNEDDWTDDVCLLVLMKTNYMSIILF